MGEAEGRRITEAIAVAAHERLPLVSVLSSGGARMQEGMRSLIQMQRVARWPGGAGSGRVPHVCVVRHPTTGGVWASVGRRRRHHPRRGGGGGGVRRLTGARGTTPATRTRRSPPRANGNTGFIDAVHPPDRLREQLALALELLSPGSPRAPAASAATRGAAARDRPSGWEQVQRARDPERPRADDYLEDYFARDPGDPRRPRGRS